jgi:hypothetical protein
VGEKLRVVHVGTGYTGSIALRQILRSPHFELVGHLVHGRDKVGRDAGELVGESAANVEASDSFADFVALDADCVTYFATVSGRDSNEVVGQLCALLASGKNVVTPSCFGCLIHHRWTTPRASSWPGRAAEAIVPCSPRALHPASPAISSPCTPRA